MKLLHRQIRKSRGFTLIELIVVIAILGVLASVVLVSINPLEQLAKARDGGRKSSVAQLGHAMEAYTTNIGGTYPASVATWQSTVLVASGNLKAIVVAPTGVTTPCSSFAEGGFCYNQLSAGTNAVIWTLSESKSELSKAGCTGIQVAAEIWEALQGKTGVACLATAATVPTAGMTLR